MGGEGYMSQLMIMLTPINKLTSSYGKFQWLVYEYKNWGAEGVGVSKDHL